MISKGNLEQWKHTFQTLKWKTQQRSCCFENHFPSTSVLKFLPQTEALPVSQLRSRRRGITTGRCASDCPSRIPMTRGLSATTRVMGEPSSDSVLHSRSHTCDARTARHRERGIFGPPRPQTWTNPRTTPVLHSCSYTEWLERATPNSGGSHLIPTRHQHRGCDRWFVVQNPP